MFLTLYLYPLLNIYLYFWQYENNDFVTVIVIIGLFLVTCTLCYVIMKGKKSAVGKTGRILSDKFND